MKKLESDLPRAEFPSAQRSSRRDGALVSRGRNRRVQQGDPSIHGETDAFRRAGRQRSYRDLIMVTTLAPCWYCSGLVRQFRIGTVVVGESRTFCGRHRMAARERRDHYRSGFEPVQGTAATVHRDCIPKYGMKTSARMQLRIVVCCFAGGFIDATSPIPCRHDGHFGRRPRTQFSRAIARLRRPRILPTAPLRSPVWPAESH